MENIANSIVRCGGDNGVRYKKIFLGYKTEWIPEGAQASAMLSMTISDWEKAVKIDS